MLIKEKILIDIKYLIARPKMFVRPGDFYNIVDYLYGYLTGVLTVLNTQNIPEITDWFHDNVALTSNQGWPWHILNKMSNGNEELAKKVLLEVFEKYLDLLAEKCINLNAEAIPLVDSFLPGSQNLLEVI